MARPTLASKQARAEEWMQEAFGRSMRDHVRATGYGRISTAVVDVGRIMKLSKAPALLRDWAAEDQKSPAGAKAKITATSVFALLTLQKLLGRPTLLTEIQTTFTELSPANWPSSESHTARKKMNSSMTGSGPPFSDSSK